MEERELDSDTGPLPACVSTMVFPLNEMFVALKTKEGREAIIQWIAIMIIIFFRESF